MLLLLNKHASAKRCRRGSVLGRVCANTRRLLLSGDSTVLHATQHLNVHAGSCPSSRRKTSSATSLSRSVRRRPTRLSRPRSSPASWTSRSRAASTSSASVQSRPRQQQSRRHSRRSARKQPSAGARQPSLPPKRRSGSGRIRPRSRVALCRRRRHWRPPSGSSSGSSRQRRQQRLRWQPARVWLVARLWLRSCRRRLEAGGRRSRQGGSN